MKKEFFAILLLLMFSLAACGDDSNEEIQALEPETVQDSIPTISGEFIFLSDEAVLKGQDFIYGVEIDSISRDLAQRVEVYKEQEFEMVPVVVKAKIIQNPGNNGWDEIIEIREVLEIPVEEPASNESASEIN